MNSYEVFEYGDTNRSKSIFSNWFTNLIQIDFKINLKSVRAAKNFLKNFKKKNYNEELYCQIEKYILKSGSVT